MSSHSICFMLHAVTYHTKENTAQLSLIFKVIYFNMGVSQKQSLVQLVTIALSLSLYNNMLRISSISGENT